MGVMARRRGSVTAFRVLIQLSKSTPRHRHYRKPCKCAETPSQFLNWLNREIPIPRLNLTRATSVRGLINLIGATAMTQSNNLNNAIPAAYKATARVIPDLAVTLVKALQANRRTSND